MPFLVPQSKHQKTSGLGDSNSLSVSSGSPEVHKGFGSRRRPGSVPCSLGWQNAAPCGDPGSPTSHGCRLRAAPASEAFALALPPSPARGEVCPCPASSRVSGLSRERAPVSRTHMLKRGPPGWPGQRAHLGGCPLNHISMGLWAAWGPASPGP